MTQKSFFTLLLTVFLLSGCAHLDVKNQFTQRDTRKVTPEISYVIFSDFDIPQPVTRTFRTPYSLPQPHFISIYDVTEDTKYIGYMSVHPPVIRIRDNFAEAYLPVGKRTLMLVWSQIKGFPLIGSNYYTDFIEINVIKNQITNVAVSEYPWGQRFSDTWITHPMFTQIVMNDEAFSFCSQNEGDEDTKEQNILKFMQQVSIDSQQKYFKTYCQMLSSKQKSIFSLNEKSYEDFETEKSKIEELKNRDFQEWQNSKNKNRVFPLIQPQWVTQEK